MASSNPLTPGDERRDPADPQETQVSDHTRRIEDEDARTQAGADREPTEEEERLAEESGQVDPEVADHYREMAERGANIRGEGQVSP